MNIQNNDILRDMLVKGGYPGLSEMPSFEVDEEQFNTFIDAVRIQFPEQDDAVSQSRAVYRILTHSDNAGEKAPAMSTMVTVLDDACRSFRQSIGVLAGKTAVVEKAAISASEATIEELKANEERQNVLLNEIKKDIAQAKDFTKLAHELNSESQDRMLDALHSRFNQQDVEHRKLKKWLIVFGIVILLLFTGLFAKAQQSAPNSFGLGIQFQNHSTVLSTRWSGLTKIDCSTNLLCTWSGNTFTIIGTGGGSGSGCIPPGTPNAILIDDGASGCTDSTAIEYDPAHTSSIPPIGTSSGQIPIWDNGLGVYVPGDPLVQGLAAHDAAGAAINPVATGCYASAAAPSNVSADVDITRTWCLRNGSWVMNIAAAGALIGGDATNGLDVDVTRSVLPTGASTSAKQDDATTLLTSLDTKTPALGQALAAGSMPVVLTAAQLTVLTPVAAITNYANETGGNLAASATSLALLDDVVFVDDTATHTSGSTKLLGIGAVATPTDTAVNANDIGMLAMTLNRELMVSLTTAIPAGSNVIGHTINDTGSTTVVTGNVATTAADGSSVTLGAKADAKSTATDTTAITIMQVLKQISASVQAPPSQAVTNAGTFAVQAAITAASGSLSSGALAVGSIVDGADVTLGAKADAKSTATDTTPITVMSVLKQISASVQAPPSQAVTNTGTFAVQAAVTAASGSFSSGALASGSIASGALASGSITDGAMVTLGVKADAKSTATDTTSVTIMQVLKEISFMAQTPAALPANQTINLAQVAGTNTVTGGVAGTLAVGGCVATNVATPCNPMNMGAQAVTSENSAATTAREVQLTADKVGKLIVLPYANPENFVSGVITSAMTGTTSTSLIAAPAGSLRNYITQITCSNSHATVGTDIIIQDGNGGTTFYLLPAAAVYGGAVLTFPVPLTQPTAATALYVANVTTGASTKCAASGYKGL